LLLTVIAALAAVPGDARLLMALAAAPATATLQLHGLSAI
jgi:hypothetical protein